MKKITQTSIIRWVMFFAAINQLHAQKKVISKIPKNQQIQQQNRWVVDKIVARVNGKNILLSDLRIPRTSNGGSPNTLAQQITEEVCFQASAKRRLIASTQDVSRSLYIFKANNNLTNLSDEEFRKQFEDSGITLDAFKDQLHRFLSIENLKRSEVLEKTVVSNNEVAQFCSDNPEYEPEQYHLKKFTFTQSNIASYKKLLSEQASSAIDLGWIPTNSLEKKYASALKQEVGFISEPIKSDDEYAVFVVAGYKQKRLKTTSERYPYVEQKLKQNKEGKLLVDLEKNLIKESLIHVI